MVTVWGRATSSNVQAVMWACAEVGLDVERIDLGGSFGGNDDPEFRAMNPNGLIPVLKDGDTVLFESAAIVRYVAARYGSPTFWPSDPAQRAELDVWAEWTKTTLCPAIIYNIFWTLIRTPAAERDWDNFKVQVTKTGELMTVADSRIGNNAFLAGDDISFADIMFGHVLYRYYTLDFDRLPLKNLQDYYDRLTQRPSYQENVMVDYSALKVD